MEIFGIKTARAGKVFIHNGKDGKPFTTNLWDKYGWYAITSNSMIDLLNAIAKKSKDFDVTEDVAKVFATCPDPASIGYPLYKIDRSVAIPSTPSVRVRKKTTPESSKTYTEEEYKETRKNIECAFKKAWDFFSEFNYHPKDRMLDTLSHYDTIDKARMYIKSYFALCNHPDRNEIAEKIKSDEFTMVWRNIHKYECPDHVNKRLEIFWGEPSGGKSTEARKRYPNAKRFKVGPSMGDDELVQVFDFTDETGKPHFYSSVLVDAMINGEPIIIDEINHLKYDTLVAMQDFLDNTDSFITTRKEEIKIKEGFKIIGTMNLDIDGATFALPEAIVDRCYNLEEFETTPELLAERFTNRYFSRA